MSDLISENRTFTLSSYGHTRKYDFETRFQNELRLDPTMDHYVALKSCSMSKAWYNISSYLNNHTFEYSSNSGSTWNATTLVDGLWGVEALDGEFSTITNGGVRLAADTTVGKVKMTLGAGYFVRFTVGELYKLLGFSGGVTYTATGLAPKLANIDHINTINIHCSMIDQSYSYVDGKPTEVIYTIPPRNDVTPFGQFDGVSYDGGEYKLSSNRIPAIRIWMTDQDGHALIYESEVVYVLMILSRYKSNA